MLARQGLTICPLSRRRVETDTPMWIIRAFDRRLAAPQTAFWLCVAINGHREMAQLLVETCVQCPRCLMAPLC